MVAPGSSEPDEMNLAYFPDWVTAEDFKPIASAYILRGLKKGIPSLFVDLKPLYHDAQKRAIIEDLVDGYRRTLEEGCLPDEPSDDVMATSNSDVPTTYLWTLYFLAQHFSHIGQHTRALSFLSSAITHTPTLPELHTLRGRVLKHLGDLHGASVAVNEARLLDGQDRFLNTKSAKYKLRAGLIEEASDTFGLFTKVPGLSSSCLLLILYIPTLEGCCEPWC
jgi:N-alpha-acetyltransferase 15/16, NatA auxiliary subunit